MMANRNINAYQKESVKSQMADADSYTIIKMLMQGVLERLAKGKGCIERSDLKGKAEHLSRATAIINALADSLDFEAGGDNGKALAENLSSLYQYMNIRIADASIDKATEPLVEVMTLMQEIKSGWDAIPADEVQKGLQLQSQRA
jgi:flagellar secretion chaperone FliS